ncbi:MAG: regulatory protein GemA [Sphingomonadaceae bacterium]|nr:regulatory protein GemA [Sphingomonadaceae bacterium]
MAVTLGLAAHRKLQVTLGKMDSRAARIKALRAACAVRKICEEDYRSILERATGKRSAADCDLAELGLALDAVNALPRPDGRAAQRPAHAKAVALWWNLYWLNEIAPEEPGQVLKALDRFVERQTGMAALKFLPPRQCHSVIEALKDWCTRAGVQWPADDERREWRNIWSAPPALLRVWPATAVCEALWARLYDAHAVREQGFEPMTNWLRSAVSSRHPPEWTSRDWERGVTALGKLWRRTAWKAARKGEAS